MKLSDYQPLLVGVLVAIGALVVWYFSSLVITEEILPKHYDYIFRLITVLVGAFIGAVLAFISNRISENKRNRTEEIKSIQYALFVLKNQVNILTNYSDIFRKYKTSFEKGFCIGPLCIPSSVNTLVDFTSLKFILVKSDPNILMEISAAQHSFHQAMSSIETRNHFYQNDLIPELSRLGIRNDPVSQSFYEEKLPKRVYIHGIDCTNQVCNLLESNITNITKKIDELRNAAFSLFPEELFII